MKNETTAERRADRELVITRTFDAPAKLVFEAWTTPELLKRWWAPRSMPISFVSCEADVRVGGSYRFVFDVGDSKTIAFFGKYLDVVPNARLVWTNEEGPRESVTTVTFEEKAGKTLLVMSEVHSSKEALDANMGVAEGMRETFGQLDELLVVLAAALNRV